MLRTADTETVRLSTDRLFLPLFCEVVVRVNRAEITVEMLSSRRKILSSYAQGKINTEQREQERTCLLRLFRSVIVTAVPPFRFVAYSTLIRAVPTEKGFRETTFEKNVALSHTLSVARIGGCI